MFVREVTPCSMVLRHSLFMCCTLVEACHCGTRSLKDYGVLVGITAHCAVDVSAIVMIAFHSSTGFGPLDER
jgi:hypothetical protein